MSTAETTVETTTTTAPAAKKTKAKPAAKKTASKPAARKTAGTRKQSTDRVRPPAAELMAKRRRMFFGASYINGVLAGFHRDHAKMLQHAIYLKVDQPARLKALSMEKLREKLADAILSKPNGAEPFSIHLDQQA